MPYKSCAPQLLTALSSCYVQEWIPDQVWLNIVALSGIDALRDIPDSVFRNDGLWRQWYDAEAPETAPVPDYQERLTKFERMCVVKVCCCYGLEAEVGHVVLTFV